MKDEVLGFFKEFYEHNRFIKSLNATFLVLIRVEDFKDLRPISLVGGLYKILTKVLANRIKRVMGINHLLSSKCLRRRETDPWRSFNS